VVRVLFVCLGNICRSPTAEGVMRALAVEAGVDHRIEIDSAGTGSWHVGHPPDVRATAAAARRGIELAGAARRVEPSDLDRFDLVIAMDRDNLAELRRMAGDSGHGEKLALLRQYDEAAAAAGELEVPDPYYGGEDGFDLVLDVVTAGCRGLLLEIAEQHMIDADGNA
jgi:low molecular weight protein-tyrosine phosphatase